MIPVVEIVAQKEGGLMRAIFVAVFIAVFSVAGLRLFWPQESQKVVDFVSELFGGNADFVKSNELLTVIFPDNPQSLNPFSLSPDQRQRFNSVYEPLVKLTPDLDTYSGLAMSWGMLDDLRWHFSLRKGVEFHDGSEFTADDVVYSFKLASAKNSDLASFLSPIAEVKKIDNFNVEILTSVADPLLVQRVAKVLIVPSEWTAATYNGTGPYRLTKFEPGNITEFERFIGYWGDRPFYQKVRVLAIADKLKRVNTFLTGTVDLLSFVSYDAANAVKERGFKLAAVPSLEVQFLLFNLKTEFFGHVEARKAINMAVNKSDLVSSVGGYARAVTQFVSSGVFGFNSDIEGFNYDLVEAEKLIEKAKLKGSTVQFHLQKGLDIVGEHIRTQLAAVGVNVVVSYLEPPALQNSLENRDADMYFLGFKSDFADSMDLFSALFAADSEDNISGYDSEEFTLLMLQAVKELKPDVRLIYLKEAMKILAVKDIVGVPLFEYESLYGFKKELNFKPRIDGQIYFEEIN